MSSDCKRCGNCCKDVGRTFWKIWDLLRDFEGFPFLEQLASNGYYDDDELPCEMLLIQNGLATCLIEKFFGRAAKPTVCKEHKGDDRCPK